MMQSVYLQRIIKKNADKGYEKTKPKQTQFLQRPKMNASVFATKDYENETAFRLQKNKPKQTQFQTRRRFFSASPVRDALRRTPWDCLLHKRLHCSAKYSLRSTSHIAEFTLSAAEGGLAMTFFGAFLQRVAARPEKNVGTMNLLAIKSYKIYLNRCLLLSN